MEILGEFFIEILFRQIIAGFFGYYTIFFFYKLSRNKQGLIWLESELSDEGGKFGKGLIIGIIGIVSISILFISVIYLYDLIMP